ncbi:DUF4129 domain-containing protein [Kibdelosporangium lantanae]
MTDIPIDVSRDAAQDAANRELADPIYHDEPGLLDRVLRWIGQRIDDLFGTVDQVVPGGILGLVVIAALVVVAVVVVRTRAGRLVRAPSAAVFTGKVLSARDYRRAADQAVANGDLALAVRERFRAIARGLEERGVLDPRSGRTVDELAREAGRTLPNFRDPLRSAARLFDDVWYGGRTATREGYERLVELDLALDGVRR